MILIVVHRFNAFKIFWVGILLVSGPPVLVSRKR
jgi:hypothetical protein